MLKYENLPSAPNKEEREEMIEDLKTSPDYEDNDVCNAILTNIRLGFLVVVRDDLMSITKEGHDHYEKVIKAGLN